MAPENTLWRLVLRLAPTVALENTPAEKVIFSVDCVRVGMMIYHAHAHLLSIHYILKTGESSESTCTNCDAGKFSSTAGASTASSCTGCGPGTYLPTAGNQAEEDCIPCQAGTYSPSAGASTASTCAPCGAGKFSSSTAAATAASCQSCPPGKFSEASGATQVQAIQVCRENVLLVRQVPTSPALVAEVV